MNLYGHSAPEAAKILGVKMSYLNSVIKGYQKEPKSWAAKLQDQSSPEVRSGPQDPLPLSEHPKGGKSATAQSQHGVAGVSVAPPAAKDGVGHDSVIYPSHDGCKEHDILSDGYARGYLGDSTLMRVYYRTPQALRRILEKKNNASGCRFAGMGDLPPAYKITSYGGVITLFGEVVNFDTTPSVGTSAAK